MERYTVSFHNLIFSVVCVMVITTLLRPQLNFYARGETSEEDPPDLSLDDPWAYLSTSRDVKLTHRTWNLQNALALLHRNKSSTDTEAAASEAKVEPVVITESPVKATKAKKEDGLGKPLLSASFLLKDEPVANKTKATNIPKKPVNGTTIEESGENESYEEEEEEEEEEDEEDEEDEEEDADDDPENNKVSPPKMKIPGMGPKKPPKMPPPGPPPPPPPSGETGEPVLDTLHNKPHGPGHKVEPASPQDLGPKADIYLRLNKAHKSVQDIWKVFKGVFNDYVVKRPHVSVEFGTERSIQNTRSVHVIRRRAAPAVVKPYFLKPGFAPDTKGLFSVSLLQPVYSSTYESFKKLKHKRRRPMKKDNYTTGRTQVLLPL